MLLRNKLTVLLIFLGMIQMSLVQAEIVGTSELLHSTDRAQIVQTLERKDVQQQLINFGVDPASAVDRVNKMTDAEIAQVNGRLAKLPAGAGVSTVELLLIIIILILVA